MNPTVRLLAAALTTAALCAFATAGGAYAADRYVALGDSYTAAPFVLNPVGQPIGCVRSDHNYPSIVTAAIRAASFRDVSCSSATTEHMLNPQPVTAGTNPPQFNALATGDATLVTIGIGGNDVGLVGAALKCIQLGLLAPTGTACRSSFATPGGGDALVDQIAASAPKIAATLQGIRQRAPQARVLIVGYPAVAPADGRSCYPLVPLSADDLAYFDELLRATNQMLAAQAAANHVEYVDTYEESVGHDVCTAPGTRWFEGVVPTMPAYPVHPNALGEASMARSVLRVLASPRPAAVLGALTRSRRTTTSGRGLRITYELSRAAEVTFGIQRALGSGRHTPLRRLATVSANAGGNAISLRAAKLGRRAGLYRITATPADGAAQTVRFRIRRRAR